MILALVNNNIVTDVVAASNDEEVALYSKQCQIALDITTTSPIPTKGWTFNGNTLICPPGVMSSIKITRLAFRQRFTFTELCTLQSAANNNVVAIQVLTANLAASNFIDLGRADTISGVWFLVSLGLLSAPRANIILTTSPSEQEKYII